jgi:hypothetical protein
MKIDGATGWIRFGSILVCVVVFLGLAIDSAWAQDASRTVEQTYQFDERGDAKIEFNFQLARAPWEMWKAQYGEHPDMLLRIINHDMAAAVIEDFALEKDDTHRHATARFKARALAQYRGSGQFEIQVPKNMKLVTGSGLEWVFTNSISERTPQGTGIVNMTYRAKLPPKARDAHMVNGNDFSRLVYSLEVSPSKPKTLLYSGVVLIVAALVAAVMAIRARGTTAFPPALPPATDSPAALPPS